MENLVSNTKNTILTHGLIPEGDGVLVGVSGGADSVALLWVLKSLSADLGFSLYAAHLNHGIRGAEAEEDQQYVRTLCRELDVPLYEETLDIPGVSAEEGKTLEQAAREQRYEFFQRACTRFGANTVAVAHHMDDQAESIMLHLIRGSGLKGLTGMKYRRGNIIRPFLDCRRSEIESFLAAGGISYRTDSTNLMRDASRNRLRLDVMPYIAEHINPAFAKSLCAMGRLLSEDEEYLSSAAEAALDAAATSLGYDRAKLLALPSPIRSRAIRIALQRSGVHADIDRVHVERIVSLLDAPTGASADLPHIAAWVSYGDICFGRRHEAQSFEVPFEPKGKTCFPGGFFLADTAENDIIKSNLIGFMDADRLPQGIAVRPRRPGDVFHPCGAPGSKKLKAVLIDRKVPRNSRDVPGLFCENEALFLPGLGISDKLKVTDDTRSVIRVQYIKD